MCDHELLGSSDASESWSDEPDEQAELGSFCAVVHLSWVLVQSLRATGGDTKFAYRSGFGWQQHIRIVLTHRF